MQNVYNTNKKKITVTILVSYFSYKVITNYFASTTIIQENPPYLHSDKHDIHTYNHQTTYLMICFIITILLFLYFYTIYYTHNHDSVTYSNAVENVNNSLLIYEQLHIPILENSSIISSDFYEENSSHINSILSNVNDHNMLITFVCSIIICSIVLYTNDVNNIDILLDSLIKPTLTVSNYHFNDLEKLQEYIDKSNIIQQITIFLGITYIILYFCHYYHCFTGITIMFILHTLFNLRKDDDIYIYTANKYTIITEIFILLQALITSILSNNFFLSIFQYHNLFSCILLFIEIIKFEKNKNYNSQVITGKINFSQHIIHCLNMWSNTKILFIHSILILSLSIFNGYYTCIFVLIQCMYIFYRHYISITCILTNTPKILMAYITTFKKKNLISEEETKQSLTTFNIFQIYYQLNLYNHKITCSTNINEMKVYSKFSTNTFLASNIFNNKIHYFLNNQDDQNNTEYDEIKNNYHSNFVFKKESVSGIYNEIYSSDKDSKKLDIDGSGEYAHHLLYGRKLPIYLLRIMDLYYCWNNYTINTTSIQEAIKKKKEDIIDNITDTILNEIVNLDENGADPLNFNVFIIMNQPINQLPEIITSYLSCNYEEHQKFTTYKRSIQRNLKEFTQTISENSFKLISKAQIIRHDLHLKLLNDYFVSLNSLISQQRLIEQQYEFATEIEKVTLNTIYMLLSSMILFLQNYIQHLRQYIENKDQEFYHIKERKLLGDKISSIINDIQD